MSFEAVVNFINTINQALAALKGLGDVMVYVGFTVLLVIGILAGIVYAAKVFRFIIANLTPRSFVLFLVAFAAVLVAVGAVIP